LDAKRMSAVDDYWDVLQSIPDQELRRAIALEALGRATNRTTDEAWWHGALEQAKLLLATPEEHPQIIAKHARARDPGVWPSKKADDQNPPQTAPQTPRVVKA
jgi:hypothetical protein